MAPFRAMAPFTYGCLGRKLVPLIVPARFFAAPPTTLLREAGRPSMIERFIAVLFGQPLGLTPLASSGTNPSRRDVVPTVSVPPIPTGPAFFGVPSTPPRSEAFSSVPLISVLICWTGSPIAFLTTPTLVPRVKARRWSVEFPDEWTIVDFFEPCALSPRLKWDGGWVVMLVSIGFASASD
jgi:hypothetical protein